MKVIQSKLMQVFVTLSVLFTFGSATAQQYKVDVGDPKFDALPSPEVGGNTNEKNFNPKDWLEAEVKIKIASDSDIKFIDKVTVTWYVAAKSPEGKGHLLLSKEVDHINVPVNEDVYLSVYLSPTSVLRLSGGDRASKSIVSHVGGEILINGVKPVKNTGYFTSKDKIGWWTKPGLSAYNKIPLLNKNETPFKFLWWGRYAEIEVSK